MSPEFNVTEQLQDRERVLLMRWTNNRLNLQNELKGPIGRAYFGFGGISWEIRTLDRMISLSIPRFRVLGMEAENEFVLEAFSHLMTHYESGRAA